jgi:GNAT superfamily N-acetyltransferase
MYKIVIDKNPKECDKKIIIDGLIENSKNILGTDDFKEQLFSLFLKDESNNIQGGIFARYDLESIYIDLLWVADNSRHLGYGSQLLNAAEVEAQKFGCRYSTLDTYSFEAEGFYLKNGYERFGEIKNYWLHHSRIFLRKILL